MSTSTNVVLIRPTRGFAFVRLRDLWEFKELLFFLLWRDVRVRYKQTSLGALWAILQPLLMMAIFSFIFGRLVKVPSDGIPYPLFALTALVPWTLFSQSLAASSESLVASESLITKVYFPRILIPVAAAGSFIVDFLISLALLGGVMALYGYAPGVRIVWLPGFVAFAFVTAVAVGVWLAALNVRYRDVRYAVPFIVQLWFFATPITYPSSLLSERAKAIFGLNPMSGVVEGFRWVLLDTPEFPLGQAVVSLGATLLILAAGLFFFRSSEKSFADHI